MAECRSCGNETLSKYYYCRRALECRRKNDAARSRARTARRPKGSYIYVIGTNAFRPVKIGSATDVKQRVTLLQAGSPFQLIVLTTISADMKLERKLHCILECHRMLGEWYRIGTHEDAVTIVTTLVELAPKYTVSELQELVTLLRDRFARCTTYGIQYPEVPRKERPKPLEAGSL